MKRAQITMFIIVAIVIIFALGVAVYLASLVNEQDRVIPVDQGKGNLRTCLEEAVNTALATIGEYGGTPTQALATNVLVARSVGGPLVPLVFGIEAPQVPPPANTRVTALPVGTVVLEPLCLLNGPNRPSQRIAPSNDCIPGTYQLFETNDHVLQYAIERLTEEYSQHCGLNRTAAVLLGHDDVTVTSGNISVKSTIRFKRMYNAAFMIARADAKDLFFDKRGLTAMPGCAEPGASNECLLPGLQTGVLFDPAHEASILTITDTKQLLYRAPFSVGIENRPPVLYYGGYYPTVKLLYRYARVQEQTRAGIVVGDTLMPVALCSPEIPQCMTSSGPPSSLCQTLTATLGFDDCPEAVKKVPSGGVPWMVYAPGKQVPIPLNVTDPDDETTFTDTVDDGITIPDTNQLVASCERTPSTPLPSLPDYDGVEALWANCNAVLLNAKKDTPSLIHTLQVALDVSCAVPQEIDPPEFSWTLTVGDASGATTETHFDTKILDDPEVCCSGDQQAILRRNGNRCCEGTKAGPVGGPLTYCYACPNPGEDPSPFVDCCDRDIDDEGKCT